MILVFVFKQNHKIILKNPNSKLAYRKLAEACLLVDDLDNAANSTNYEKLDDKVKGWCAMLKEAVIHQINKAYKANDSWYEEG